jgi:hypothetical protein
MDDLMKPSTLVLTVAGLALAGMAGAAELNAQSDKAQGQITLASDLVLNDGRLVIKVVGYNKTGAPVELMPAAITVTTVAGKAVPLASLAQLEDETRIAYGAKPLHKPDDYANMSSMQRPVVVTSSGERDVSGYTGGDNMSSSVTARSGKKLDEARNPELKAALDNLRAAILAGVSVAPRSAAGGQIVTQSFKFGRKEQRKLKVAVAFAGETHVLEFEVPRQ